jgi:mono/diheme cytochrome c family protein
MRALVALVVIAFLAVLSGNSYAGPPEKWGKYCARCHGEDGKGKTKMGEKLGVKDMTTAQWQKSKKEPEMKKAIREGNPALKKPAHGPDKLSDGEIDELVKFVRTLKTK